jgi:ABC-2 type transport system permease protein
MNPMAVVAEKEVRQILGTRNLLVSALIFAVIFGGMSAPAVLSGEGEMQAALDQLCFSLVLTLGLFNGYLFSGQAFLREKQSGIIETMLCTPLSVRQIWLGKVAGVVVPAYGMTVFAALLIIGIGSWLAGGLILPSPPVLVYLALVVPLFIAVAAGILGFFQLLLGMRENQILNIGVLFVIIFALTFIRELLGPDIGIFWQLVGVVFVVGILAFAGVMWITRLLDTEKIVTTIP